MGDKGDSGTGVREAFTWALLVFFPIYLVAWQYSFPTANQGQELLPILARLDPQLLTRDFATATFAGPGPRYLYILLVSAVASTGLPLWAVMFGLYAISIVTIFAGFIALVSPLLHGVGRWRMALAGAFIAAATTVAWGWDVNLVAAAAIPSTFAMAATIWGIVAASRRRWVAAYALFGAAALLQVLVGLLPGLLLGPMAAYDLVRRRQWGHAVAGAAVFAIGLAPAVVPTLTTATGGSVWGPETLRPLEFFAFVRAPHHYVPSSATAAFWPNLIAYGVAAVLLVRRRLAPMPAGWSAAIAVLLAVGVVAPVAAFLGTEVWFVDAIVKLQLQRVIPFTRLAILVIVLAAACEAVRTKRPHDAIALLLAPIMPLYGWALLLVAGTVRGPLTLLPLIAVGLAAVASVALSPMFFLSSILVAFLMLVPSLVAALLVSSGTRRNAPLAIVAAVSLAFAGLGFAAQRWSPAVTIEGPVERLAVRLSGVTRPDALVLVPPSFGFEKFSLLSERNLWVDIKNTPFDETGMRTHQTRLKQLAGMEIVERSDDAETLLASYREQPAASLVALARAADIDVVVVNREWHGELGGMVRLASEGKWEAWAFPDSDAVLEPRASATRPRFIE